MIEFDKARIKDVVNSGLTFMDKGKCWTKGYSARDVHDHEIEDVFSPAAVAFCSLGSIQRAAGCTPSGQMTKEYYDAAKVLDAAAESLGYGSVPRYNDDPNMEFAGIEILFARAIEIIDSMPEIH